MSDSQADGPADQGRVGEKSTTLVSLDSLQRQFNELNNLAQQLLTEKLFLENECNQLKKKANRLDEEIRNLKTPPLVVGNIQDVSGDEVIVRSSNGTVFLVSVNKRIDPELLVAGARVSLNQDTLSIIDVLVDSWDPLVVASEVIEKPIVTYADIGGVDQQIKDLIQSVELPLLNPEAFKKMGIEPPKGVLLTGPPGTGKTMLAKAVANSTSATFLGMVGSELAQKYIGEGGRLVRELFDLARQRAPAIIFIDEIDAIGSKRLDSSTSGDREVQRTLMQLLAEMDGFNSLENVKIIAATNRPELLDRALLRPGRFDRVIDVGLPDFAGRTHILTILTKDVPLDSKIDLADFARKTEGFTGAELKALIIESGMAAIEADANKVELKHLSAGHSRIVKNRKDPLYGVPEALYG
jgi:proteasome regulatory subunit|tara:strand:+ start:1691 stop:2923 length:1233 start_codon:yes stop_codon:yes gene_type:complete